MRAQPRDDSKFEAAFRCNDFGRSREVYPVITGTVHSGVVSVVDAACRSVISTGQN